MLEVLMPPLPPRVKKVKLVEWHKAEGDEVQQGDLLAVIETNKAAIDIEAEHEGMLVKILVAEGTEEIAAGTPLAVLKVAREILDSVPAVISATDELLCSTTAPLSFASRRDAMSLAHPLIGEGDTCNAMGESVHVSATPLAKRIAEQRGINLSSLSGSGPYGRIVEKDLEQVRPSEASSRKKVVHKGKMPAKQDCQLKTKEV